MSIVPLYGHETLVGHLIERIRGGGFPASLLLHGPRGVGKQRLALRLAQALLCERGDPPCDRCQQCRFALELGHPDLHWYFPRPRPRDADISVEDVAQDYTGAINERKESNGLYAPPSGLDGLFISTTHAIVWQAAFSPAIAARKVFVVGEADRMVPQEGAEQAANAFLKLLEEPPENTHLILTSSEPGALLPTIRSRVVAIRVPRMTDEAVRGFVRDPLVKEALGRAGTEDELVARASGAPGSLLSASEQQVVVEGARRFLHAAESGEGGTVYRLALAQGSSRARGTFSDMLDALSVLLHQRVRAAVAQGNDRLAVGAGRAIARVERAKEQAHGNVNPQLIATALLRDIQESLA